MPEREAGNGEEAAPHCISITVWATPGLAAVCVLLGSDGSPFVVHSLASLGRGCAFLRFMRGPSTGRARHCSQLFNSFAPLRSALRAYSRIILGIKVNLNYKAVLKIPT